MNQKELWESLKGRTIITIEHIESGMPELMLDDGRTVTIRSDYALGVEIHE